MFGYWCWSGQQHVLSVTNREREKLWRLRERLQLQRGRGGKTQTSDSGKEGHNCCGAHTPTHTCCSFFWICSSFTPHLTIFPLRLWGFLEVLVSGPEFSLLSQDRNCSPKWCFCFYLLYDRRRFFFSLLFKLLWSSVNREPFPPQRSAVCSWRDAASMASIFARINTTPPACRPCRSVTWPGFQRYVFVCTIVYGFFNVPRIRFVQSSNSTK